MRAPFIYFGGKSKVAHIVWEALGNPAMFIEPFFGSGAVLLNRPKNHLTKNIFEIVNDKDGFVSNVWRALRSNPNEVAKYCDWPANHADLMSRRLYLRSVEGRLLKALVKNPKFYNAKLAGYWIYVASSSIAAPLENIKSRPSLSKQGINKFSIIQPSDDPAIHNEGLYKWFRLLSERLRHVTVFCGNWDLACRGNWQDSKGNVGVFFDPPYGVEDRDTRLYRHDSTSVAGLVNEWCAKRGALKTHRIVVAGYEEYENLLSLGWSKLSWKAGGGLANLGKGIQGHLNRHRETLYFSPHCLPLRQETKLFDL